jgi:hypothetical protein
VLALHRAVLGVQPFDHEQRGAAPEETRRVRGGDSRAEAGADGSDDGLLQRSVGALEGEGGVLLVEGVLVVRLALGVLVVSGLSAWIGTRAEDESELTLAGSLAHSASADKRRGDCHWRGQAARK